MADNMIDFVAPREVRGQVSDRISKVLDTFETSIANLEAQLELREKQYEYYRDKLLKFE